MFELGKKSSFSLNCLELSGGWDPKEDRQNRLSDYTIMILVKEKPVNTEILNFSVLLSNSKEGVQDSVL
jgi:hypothetical protein